MYEQAVDFLSQLMRRVPARSQRSARAVQAEGRKSKKRGKKAIQRCQQQVATCEPIFTAQCNGDQACLAERVPCCSLLSICDFNGFLICLNG